MDLFFWIVDLLIPTMMMIIGALFKFLPPKKINMLYGYRTSRSMASQEAWDYAHPLCGKIWMMLGAGLVVFIIADKLVLPVKPEFLSLANAGISMLCLILPIPFIEKKLKEKFGSPF